MSMLDRYGLRGGKRTVSRIPIAPPKALPPAKLEKAVRKAARVATQPAQKGKAGRPPKPGRVEFTLRLDERIVGAMRMRYGKGMNDEINAILLKALEIR